jgi:hypothetical protein
MRASWSLLVIFLVFSADGSSGEKVFVIARIYALFIVFIFSSFIKWPLLVNTFIPIYTLHRYRFYLKS